jgi:hypothetical protein
MKFIEILHRRTRVNVHRTDRCIDRWQGGCTVDARNVTHLDVLLSIVLHDGDAHFSYLVEPGWNGDWLADSYNGKSNVTYGKPPVPESSMAVTVLARLR